MRIFFPIGVILTGLSAGLFFNWAVSIIPGLQALPDAVFIRSMQAINKSIQNPAFFTIFFGPVIFLLLLTCQLYRTKQMRQFNIILISFLLYTIGVVCVTVIGNVPLNNKLQNFALTTDSTALSVHRSAFEYAWNSYHYIRTVAAVIAFILVTYAFMPPREQA